MATDYEDPIYTPAPKPAQEAPTEQPPATPTEQPPATPPNTPPPPSPPKDEAPTSTQTQISSVIPAQYTASSYAELIPQLEKQMQQYKPPTEEELKKMRRKQRIEGIIAGISDAAQSVANLWFTHNYAPNMYDANSGMSAKTKARFDKEKAEREADTDRYFNYALNIGKMKDADRDAGLKAWAIQQDLARQDRNYDANRQDRAEDVEFRNKDYDERVRQWQENFDREGEWHNEEAERWERQFTESIRQFNVQSSLERQRIGLEAQRLAQSVKQNQFTFSLGGNNGTVTLSMDRLNAQTVSQLFYTLPENVRSQVKGEPIMQGVFEVGNKPPTTEAMLIAIGANVENSPNTQNAIRRLAGQSVAKPAGY